jgi:valyl-tRNA synthetase
MLQPYPSSAEFPPDDAAEREIAWVQSIVLAVRQIRGEINISPTRAIPVLMKGASAADLERAQRCRPYLDHLAGLASLTALGDADPAPNAATGLAGAITIFVPMAGLIDAKAEADRLAKRIARGRQDLAKTRVKLADDHFVRNAPEAVVRAERERAAELERAVTGLETQLARVRSLLPP